MAVDESPPRIGLIVGIAVTTVLTLGGLKFAFDSYFIALSEEAVAEKRAPTTQLTNVRAEAEKHLTTSPVSITAAMTDLGRGRSEVGGPDVIAPRPSDDLGAMTGWTKNPRRFDIPAKPADARDTVPSPTAPADGGTALATDGGATLATADAGATTTAGGDAGPRPRTAPPPTTQRRLAPNPF